jgi:hypothetical protein
LELNAGELVGRHALRGEPGEPPSSPAPYVEDHAARRKVRDHGIGELGADRLVARVVGGPGTLLAGVGRVAAVHVLDPATLGVV